MRSILHASSLQTLTKSQSDSPAPANADSDSVDLGWDPRGGISNKPADIAKAAQPQPTLGATVCSTTLPWTSSVQRPKTESQAGRILQAGSWAWPSKGGSANGCSAGFSPGEQVQLEVICGGRSQSHWRAPAQNPQEASTELSPTAAELWKGRITNNCLQPQSSTAPSTQPVTKSVYAKWLDLGKGKGNS